MFWCGLAIGLSVGAVIGFFSCAMVVAGRDKRN